MHLLLSPFFPLVLRRGRWWPSAPRGSRSPCRESRPEVCRPCCTDSGESRSLLGWAWPQVGDLWLPQLLAQGGLTCHWTNASCFAFRGVLPRLGLSSRPSWQDEDSPLPRRDTGTPDTGSELPPGLHGQAAIASARPAPAPPGRSRTRQTALRHPSAPVGPVLQTSTRHSKFYQEWHLFSSWRCGAPGSWCYCA